MADIFGDLLGVIGHGKNCCLLTTKPVFERLEHAVEG